jgi:hypothetical protein
MMMEIYLKHKTPEEPTISSTFILDKYKSREVYQAVVNDIIVEWFGNSIVLTKEDFMTKLTHTADKYLMPHSLRIIIRKKMAEMNML